MMVLKSVERLPSLHNLFPFIVSFTIYVIMLFLVCRLLATMPGIEEL